MSTDNDKFITKRIASHVAEQLQKAVDNIRQRCADDLERALSLERQAWCLERCDHEWDSQPYLYGYVHTCKLCSSQVTG